MWRRRKKRAGRLSRQLALGRLQDAMGQVEDQRGSSRTPAPSGVTYKVIARVPPESPDAGGPGGRRSA
jgi:hypothetical protein